MGVIAGYTRVSEDQLEEMICDPSRFDPYVAALRDFGQLGKTHLDLDKSWQSIHFLLTANPWQGAPPYCNAVLGGHELSGAVVCRGAERFSGVDYSEPRYLRSHEVRSLAAALEKVPGDELWSRFDEERARLLSRSETRLLLLSSTGHASDGATS